MSIVPTITALHIGQHLIRSTHTVQQTKCLHGTSNDETFAFMQILQKSSSFNDSISRCNASILLQLALIFVVFFANEA